MAINVNLRVTSFGQVILEMGRPSPPTEEQVGLVQKQVRYHEPQETASLVYELRYEEEAKNYIVPGVTG